MFKSFSRLLFIMLVLAVCGIIFLVSSRDTDEDLRERYVTEARSHSALIGSFMQHVVDERFDRLRVVAAIGDKSLRSRSLAEYAKFMKDHYDIQSDFGVGQMDGAMSVTQSIDYGGSICSSQSLLSPDMLNTLKKGLPYVGSVSDRCRRESLNKQGGFIIVYPLMQKGRFSGVVYDVFTLLGSKSDVWSSSVEGSSVRMTIDDGSVAKDGDMAELLALEPKAVGNVAEYNGRYIGFYRFSVDGTVFVVVYKTGRYVSRLFPGDRWGDNVGWAVFVAPVLLLFILIIIELFQVKKRLEAAVRDRTEHLEDLKNRYEGLFRTIPEYIVLYGRDGKILEQNRKCHELKCCADSGEDNVYRYITDQDRFRARVAALKKGVTDYMGEYTVRRGQETITVSVSSTLVDTESGEAVLSAFTDITEYKNMQSSFFQTQKRDVIGTVAAGMAHDFSNILQNISLQYGLAERSGDEDKRDAHLENISGIVDGARKYLQGIIKYTKNSAETAVVRNADELIRSAADIAGQIVPPDVTLKTSCAAGDTKIKVEESRFMQMIVNLCQNASDAMEKNGVIELETCVDEKPFGSFFTLRVKDTGRGIPHEELHKIFKPFYTTKDGAGTGLGLASVRQTVMDAGGMIDVKSELGKGSEFIIMIPEIK